MTTAHLRSELVANIAVLALGLLVMTYVFITDRQAFDWPAIDTAPFFIAKSNPLLLRNDFFTQASLSPNPRNVFSVPVFHLSQVFGLDWHQTLYFLKLLVSFYFPVAMITFVYSVTSILREGRAASSDKPRYFLFLSLGFFILFANASEVNRWTSIAWWAPILIQGTPSVVAMTLGFLSFGVGVKLARVLRVLAILLHPAIGVFVWLLNAILKVRTRKEILIEGFLALVPLVGLSLAFHPRVNLSAKLFTKIYFFDATPSHHVLSELGTLSNYPWYFHYLGMSAVLLSCLFCLRSCLGQNMWLRLMMLNLVYLLAPPLHWVLTEVVSIKVMAMLAPIRISTFGLSIVLVNVLLLFSRRGKPENKNTRVLFGRALLSGAILAVPLSLAAAKNLPSINEDVFSKNQPFWEFIQGSHQDAIFVVPHGVLTMQIPILAARAVYFGNGFPFSEDFFEEYELRLSQTFGTYEDIKRLDGAWIGAKYSKFYQMKGPADFCRIPGDFVILAALPPGEFVKCRAAYSDPEYRIFERKELCGCSR